MAIPCPSHALLLLCASLLVIQGQSPTQPGGCRYPGLFTSPNDISVSAQGLVIQGEVYIVKKGNYQKKFTYKETCGEPTRTVAQGAVNEQAVKLSTCEARAYYVPPAQVAPAAATVPVKPVVNPNLNLNGNQVLRRLGRSTSNCHGCCETEMSVTILDTITNVITGDEHAVIHEAASFQFIMQGECVSVGAACGTGGTCEQANAIQWVLANTTYGERFVAVNLPSHCTCIHT